jgi:hypothetical protein
VTYTYSERRSLRNASGYDAGSIHATRPVQVQRGGWREYHETACGRYIGQYGTVPHDIGPTCKRCKATIR